MTSAAIQQTAGDLLSSGQVSVVIGYEVSPRGRVRPVFVRQPADVKCLIFNEECVHNLAVYLRDQLKGNGNGKPRVAVVAKPRDTRAINVLLAENAFTRDQVHVIGVACSGEEPVLADTRIEAEDGPPISDRSEELKRLNALPPAERLDFWMAEFDKCIRCYACRQACPMCSCPTCLFERDDSLWVGMGSSVDEKRAFHLGRAFHLAGRCVGCNACEAACPLDIPIGLLNQHIAQTVAETYDYHAGMQVVPSPITTILLREEGG